MGKWVNKMGKSRAHIVIDTETAPIEQFKDGKPHPEKSLVYDCGWLVVSASGDVLERRSFAIVETFNKVDVMASAYYASKLPYYYANMGDGKEWQTSKFFDVWARFKNDIRAYNVRDVYAYNVLFDVKALNNTLRTYSNGFCNYFMPYGITIRDIWDIATCITATNGYLEWISSNGYTTRAGNPITNAETVYRYVSGDSEFIEHHTALQDCVCENAILEATKKKHTKKATTVGQGWRVPSKAYKAMHD